jgi:hypothetical protein
MKHEQMNEKPRMALVPLAEYKETLERLQRLERLCVRAADALAGCTWQERDALITELRKAGR